MKHYTKQSQHESKYALEVIIETSLNMTILLQQSKQFQRAMPLQSIGCQQSRESMKRCDELIKSQETSKGKLCSYKCHVWC